MWIVISALMKPEYQMTISKFAPKHKNIGGLIITICMFIKHNVFIIKNMIVY